MPRTVRVLKPWAGRDVGVVETLPDDQLAIDIVRTGSAEFVDDPPPPPAVTDRAMEAPPRGRRISR